MTAIIPTAGLPSKPVLHGSIWRSAVRSPLRAVPDRSAVAGEGDISGIVKVEHGDDKRNDQHDAGDGDAIGP